MEVSIRHKARPLNIKFDLYSDSDDTGFKLELLSLMITNVGELKRAAHLAVQNRDPAVYSRAVHKTKSTASLLDDAELNTAIEKLKIRLSLSVVPPNDEIFIKLNQLCESIIQSLELESEHLKAR